MKEVSVLFKELVDEIDTNITTTSYSNKRFYTCDTKWIRKGKIVFGKTSSGNSASSIVTSVVKDTYFEVSSATLVKEVRCPVPFDIVGTKIFTNIEWTKADRNLLNKTPLIWLLENHTEKVYGDEASLERDIRMKILFLDETDINNYSTSDHREQVVEPMLSLQNEFVKVLNKKPIYKRLKDFSRDTFSRFGTENENGILKNILDANLSGIIIDISVSKFKEPCKC